MTPTEAIRSLITADLTVFDAGAWVAALTPEEDVLKRSGEVIALASFATWEREMATGMSDEERRAEYDRTYLERLGNTYRGMETAKPRKQRARKKQVRV